ncbi:MAG: hypothetical protein CSA83_02700, partial [Actinomycetales bacterium]
EPAYLIELISCCSANSFPIYPQVMAQKTFALRIPMPDARNLVGAFFAQSGWRIIPDPQGNFKIERGDRTKSVLIGAFAGDDMYLSQYVTFAVGPNGETLIYYSNGASGLMGGVIGASKSKNIFNDNWQALANWLQSQGVLLGVQ